MSDLSLAGPLVGFGCTLILFALAFIMLDRNAYYGRWVPFTFMIVGALIIFGGAAVEVVNATRAQEPISQSEMIISIEELLRGQGAPAVCEPVSPTEINCTLTVDPNAE